MDQEKLFCSALAAILEIFRSLLKVSGFMTTWVPFLKICGVQLKNVLWMNLALFMYRKQFIWDICCTPFVNV